MSNKINVQCEVYNIVATNLANAYENIDKEFTENSVDPEVCVLSTTMHVLLTALKTSSTDEDFEEYLRNLYTKFTSDIKGN